ncbi:DUF4129 domain-containing protein [Antrihabitans sp. YC3-6]|uniref:DUF4129 domain-containing protein n=1 Tax=Antrihabitans stalagmiti TaxID=2799499 RepID=A0A934U333_9NOCA|nr:DUF4129 domain-containing protein [Antrihabitans stalagmiti]MBJ8339227.1 DUF4129 domain-containing protein [Antrihabitans stalagmiti]
MTEHEPHNAPVAEPLGPAAAHRDRSEHAAAQQDYSAAVQERFRAVIRGLEQGGVLETRRSRTADETAAAASDQLPADADGFTSSAVVYDEVVYGGRVATPDDYALLAHVDRFSPTAPPPAPDEQTGPDETARTARRRRRRRQRRSLRTPGFLASSKLWIVVAVTAILLVLLLFAPRSCSVPDASPPPQSQSDDGYDGGSGNDDAEEPDTLFDRLPPEVVFGGVQLFVAAVLLALWRARRRGALVPAERPVEVSANELTEAHARLYRRSGDSEHVAGVLRGSMLRRVLPRLGLAPNSPHDRIVRTLAEHTGAPPDRIGAMLYGPVEDDETLTIIAAELDAIEGEIRAR